MKAIYKFGLEVTDIQKINMPKGAKIICIQMQHERPNIWAVVDTEEVPEERWFECIGTGYPMPDLTGITIGNSRQYIGTLQAIEGKFVFHFFERVYNAN